MLTISRLEYENLRSEYETLKCEISELRLLVPDETVDHHPCVCSQCGEDLQPVSLSEGSVDTFLDRLARKSNSVYEEIRARIVKIEVVSSDEIELKKKMTKEHYLHPPEEVSKLNAELDRLLQRDCSKFNDKEQAFVKRLIKHRQSIFTFLVHAGVPPDNIASERAIRNVKVKTKVSGQFRNADGKGADRYAKIRSVIDTTIKNGQEVYAALVCLANCKIVEVPE